ncbi:MAG: Flp pilus assembly complex ATPase component TadA [Candidatus Omnitrophica bacterium]|nr:Flp pilus assembly complex ATPase component TadA [Candidatus Omnitrophota bacterium]
MAETFRERLTSLLLKSDLVDKKKLEHALAIQKKEGGALSQILVREGWISEKELLALLSQELDIPPIDLSRFKIDPEIAKMVPERIARQYHLIPISRIGNTLVISMADPLNIFAMDDLRMLTHYQIDPVLSTDKDILAAIDRIYTPQDLKISRILEGAEIDVSTDLTDQEEVDLEAIAKSPEKVPIVEIVNLILIEALDKRASDIHLEPGEDRLRIRYRIDGNLLDAVSLPKESQQAIASRLKIMCGLDITESRLPQDGRFRIRFRGKEIDFRVSVLPIMYGGKMVLRILDKSALQFGLEHLGFNAAPLVKFKEAVKKPFGMILLTGPTGCGKSTTLYSLLQTLNVPERNLTTIEDPIEYQVEGVTQIQVHPDIGLTFAGGLRSVLRQTPDVIMVGEIRDFETADIAVKSSLTGHLILSTLHTNDAPSAITRLVDMGVEPYLIASSLIVVGAQRLCRVICTNCKEKVTLEKSLLGSIGLKEPKQNTFYQGKGCRKCAKTGYFGRMGILEVLEVDDKVREMILNRASTAELTDYARKHGMITLHEDALKKFEMGFTTLEEVMRVTVQE